MTKVRFKFVDIQGNPLPLMEFKLLVRRASFNDEDVGVTLPEELNVITDVSGQVIVELWSLKTAYRIQVAEEYEELCGKLNWSFYVPHSDEVVEAQSLFLVPPPNSQPWDEEAIGKITQAVLDTHKDAESAKDSAASAEASAQSIKGDADRAEAARDIAVASEAVAKDSAAQAVTFASYADTYSTEAKASANAAAGSATSAANFRNQANTARDAAQNSQTAAKASENAAVNSATLAGQSAVAAEQSKNLAATSASTATTKAAESSASAAAALTQGNRAKTEADRAVAATDSKANKGANTDITSLTLNPEFPNTVLGVKKGELVLTSADALGAGLAVENTNGGGGVLHFYAKDYFGAAPVAGRLLGGIGPRPWDGSAYSAHSTTAIHFMSTENITSTGHGSVTKILATANGKTQDQRLCAATFNGYGDVIIGSYTQNESLSKGRGLGVIRTDTAGGRQIAGIDLVGNLAGYANQIQSWACGPTGTYESPIRAVAGQALGIGFGGHDSSVFTNARALITMRVHSASDWGPTNTPTQIVFATTAVNSATRTDRWMIEADGKFVPMADNAYSVGDANRRCSTVYAGTGAISTSDARLKSPVFKLNEAELKVSKLLLKEIGMYRFLSAVDEKEGSSREHCGMTVQRAIELFESVGLNPFNYAFICYDEWDEETVTEPADDGDDETPVKTKVIPAGSCYSFRETGLMMFMMAGLVDRLDKLEA